jgi:hypothetical protein
MSRRIAGVSLSSESDTSRIQVYHVIAALTTWAFLNYVTFSDGFASLCDWYWFYCVRFEAKLIFSDSCVNHLKLKYICIYNSLLYFHRSNFSSKYHVHISLNYHIPRFCEMAAYVYKHTYTAIALYNNPTEPFITFTRVTCPNKQNWQSVG